MTAPRWTSRLAANSTERRSAAATASASEPPSASQVAGPTTSDRVARGDGEEPQPEGGLDLLGDARPDPRPGRVDPGRVCGFAYHDDSPTMA